MDGIKEIATILEDIATIENNLAVAKAKLEEAIESYSRGFSHMEELIEVTTKSGNTYKATILHNDNLEQIKDLIYEENIEALVNLTEDRMCLVIGR